MVAFFLISNSCGTDKVFDEVVTIEQAIWDKDEVLKFNVPISDTSAGYDILVHLRNGSNYKYSNLWLFIETSAPNGNQLRDTAEFTLADPSGKWLGKGIGDVNSQLLRYKTNIRFPYRGIYKISLEQAMREEELEEIMDVGIRIQEHKPE